MGLTWCPDFVVLGGSHLESGFCLLFFRSPLLGWVWCIWFSWLIVYFVCPTGVGRQALHPQVQRLHHRRPRVLRRKRGCTLPSSSHARDGHLARLRVLRRRKDWHLSFPPHIAGMYLGGRGTGPSLSHQRRLPRRRRTGPPPHIDGKFLKCVVVAQLGRSGDTMICVKGTFAHGCSSEPLGTFCDTMRRMCVVRVGLSTVGTLRRYHPSEETATQSGRSGDTRICWWCMVCTGAELYRLGRFAIPCEGCSG